MNAALQSCEWLSVHRFYDVGRRLLVAVICYGTSLGLFTTCPEGWLTVIDSNAAIRASNDYASNVIRCVWAGDKPKVVAEMPANAAFQFAIAGNELSV